MACAGLDDVLDAMLEDDLLIVQTSLGSLSVIPCHCMPSTLASWNQRT
jgi:hypothetical protein